MIYHPHNISSNLPPQQTWSWEKSALSTIFKRLPLTYFNTVVRNALSVYTPLSLTFFLSCHYRLSEYFSLPSLIDIFGYEVPAKTVNKSLRSGKNKRTILEKISDNIIILVSSYYFSKIAKNIFSMTDTRVASIPKKKYFMKTKIPTIEIFFRNAIWLERELREMLGVFFVFKSDNRCLLLLYGSNDFPIKKVFPTQGHYILYYNTNTNSVKSALLDAQF